MRTQLPRRTAAAVLSVLIVGGLAGCAGSSDASAGTPTAASVASAGSSAAVQGPVASASVPARPDAPQRVDVMTFAEVAGQPGVTIVDVRTPAEYAAGHLEGAVNIDVEGADFAQAVAGLDPEGTYAVYCRTGNRSAAAVAAMADAGIVGTYDLDGGIVAWESAGLPIVS